MSPDPRNWMDAARARNMRRVRRAVFAVALSLLALSGSFAPSATARADSSEEWPQDWQGTITHNYHRTWRIDHLVSFHPVYYPTTSYVSENVRARIFVQADGTAIQTTSYVRTVIMQDYIYGCGYGTFTGYATGSSITPVDAPAVWVDGTKITTRYHSSGTTTTERVGEAQGCWPADRTGIETQLPFLGSVVTVYIPPWLHNGAFTPDDTRIAGRDTYASLGAGPGGNFVDQVSHPDARTTVTSTSARFTSYVLARGEEMTQDSPWLSQEWRDALNESADVFEKCGDYGSWLELAVGLPDYKDSLKKIAGKAVGAIGVVTTACDLAGMYDGWLAKDPPDPNFKQIATPVTPTTSAQPIKAGVGLTQAQADVFSALAANLQQGIGLARAMLTAFDRASGARVAGDIFWEQRQLQAARQYAAEYAILLEQRPPLFTDYAQMMTSMMEQAVNMSEESVNKYRYHLLFDGLSPEEEQMLTQMGANAQMKEEILSTKLESELGDDPPTPGSLGVFPDDLVDPVALEASKNLAQAMRELSQSGAKQIVYLPTVTH